MKQVPLVYLASPYSTPKDGKLSLQERYWCTLSATKDLIEQGFAVWSPIVHCHNLATGKVDSKFWEEFNYAFVSRCSEIWVLKIDGWDRSEGVAKEIKWAEELELRVYEVEPPEYPEFHYRIFNSK